MAAATLRDAFLEVALAVWSVLSGQRVPHLEGASTFVTLTRMSTRRIPLSTHSKRRFYAFTELFVDPVVRLSRDW